MSSDVTNKLDTSSWRLDSREDVLSVANCKLHYMRVNLGYYYYYFENKLNTQ